MQTDGNTVPYPAAENVCIKSNTSTEIVSQNESCVRGWLEYSKV